MPPPGFKLNPFQIYPKDADVVKGSFINDVIIGGRGKPKLTNGKLHCYFVRKIGKNHDGGVKNFSKFDDVICVRPLKTYVTLDYFETISKSQFKSVKIKYFIIISSLFTIWYILLINDPKTCQKLVKAVYMAQIRFTF